MLHHFLIRVNNLALRKTEAKYKNNEQTEGRNRNISVHQHHHHTWVHIHFRLTQPSNRK